MQFTSPPAFDICSHVSCPEGKAKSIVFPFPSKQSINHFMLNCHRSAHKSSIVLFIVENVAEFILSFLSMRKQHLLIILFPLFIVLFAPWSFVKRSWFGKLMNWSSTFWSSELFTYVLPSLSLILYSSLFIYISKYLFTCHEMILVPWEVFQPW